MPRVISHGELLIDFIPAQSGEPLERVTAFRRAAGGAPGNVAVGLAQLGVSVGFMGQVGNDPFGRFLARTLREAGVETRALTFTDEAPTGLAFVSLTSAGERDFLFYRSPSADMLYTAQQVDDDYVRSAEWLQIGSISMIAANSRAATLHALDVADQAGVAICLDPNLRLALWPTPGAAKDAITQLCARAQIVKLSQEELSFLVDGRQDLIAAGRSLWHTDLQAMVITQAERGCTYLTEEHSGQVPGFKVQVVDSTGAGDAFLAGLLRGLLEAPRVPFSPGRMQEVCRFANAAGALTTTRHGAIPALPTLAAVERFLSGSPPMN